ncbi:hypothetical protein KVR01_012585 [Diaporthe batatas]|uniref:uncharacterized protein n=1 Tax=Diaporthe batatas TaxID=748121 RepID=UPI001D03D70C|nr:uncharacterized protein KVR01_012585 [Diaporthe batatas]KAG8157543.1 hypothetical protein KVR01_012585 [Diaporthe batatas]
MSDKSLQFRIATPDDAVQIQNLIQSSFRTEDPRANWTGSTELASQFHISVDEVLANMHKPDCAVLVATDPADGAIVASVECVRRRTTSTAGISADNKNKNNNNGGGDLARLSMLAVDDARQRSGLGRKVLGRAEDYCRKEWGVTRLGLNALSTRGELISWYERCGFERTGETSAFPRGRFPALSLPEDLCFVELEKDLLRVA